MRRTTARRLASAVLFTPILVVIYLNIEKWAEKRGYDTLLVDALSADDPAVITLGTTLLNYATQPWVIWLSFLLGGIIVGIWVDALILRGERNQSDRNRKIGNQCQNIVTMIDAIEADDYSRIGESPPLEQPDKLNRVWSAFLPVAFDLERIGLKTPDGEINSRKAVMRVRAYAQFVGPLVASGHMKQAKQTAKNLSEIPNQPDEETDTLPLLGIAKRMWRRIRPG